MTTNLYSRPYTPVKNAIHIHPAGNGLQVMILVDDIYEEYLYQTWQEIFSAHPIMLTAKGVTLFIR